MPGAQLHQERLATAGVSLGAESMLPRNLLSNLSTIPIPATPRTYTTAGTVYNPQTVAPIQRPTRRGRMVRWSQSHYNSDTLCPKPAVSSQHPSLSAWNVPAATSRLESYAPLQQNYDRAITPPPKDDRGLSGDMEPFGPSLAQHLEEMTSPGPDVGDTSLPEKPVDVEPARSSDEKNEARSDFDVAADNLAAQFNAKGLTNLASYKNPSQKAAQRALARARPPPGGPLTSQSEPLGTPLGQKTVGRASQSGYHTAQPGSSTFHKSVFDAKALHSLCENFTRVDGTRRHDISARVPVRGIGTAAPATNRMPTYASSLSTGPGAPRPLTAGPPGLRQHRPASIGPVYRGFNDTGTSADRSTADSSSVYGDEGPLFEQREEIVGYPKAVQPLMANFARSPEPSRCSSTGRQRPVRRDAGLDGMTNSTVSSPPIVETEPTSILRPYYPYGLPSDYNKNHVSSVGTLEEGSYMPPRATGPRTQEQLDRHQARVNESWYAGVKGLHKTMEDVVREAKKRRLFRAVGRFHQAQALTMANAKLERSESPHISLDEAIKMDRAKHIEPLLNMAFASLLSHADRYGASRCRNDFEIPDPWVIDSSTAGLQSFFASTQ